MMRGEKGQLHATGSPYLVEDVHQVGLDGIFADRRSRGDLLVGIAGDHGPGNFDLALGQAQGSGAAPRALQLPQARGHSRGTLAPDPEITGHDAVDALEEDLWRGVLE